MGHKVHPKIFRIPTIATWSSRWYAGRKQYREFLRQDVRTREEIHRRFRDAGISAVEVDRSANAVTVTIQAARPGVIIGRGGQGADAMKRELRDRYFGGAKGSALQLNIVEVDRPALDAAIAAAQIIGELEKRIPFRRVIRQAAGRIERAGALGVRIQVSGRLDGAEIARREVVMHGKMPLHTIRADINYAQQFARTIYGTIGVKVWINRGEVFSEKSQKPTANSR